MIDWRDVARREGWDLFEVHGSVTGRTMELQSDSDMARYEGDLDALMFVVARANQDPDGPHADALRHWLKHDPDALREDLMSIVDDDAKVATAAGVPMSQQERVDALEFWISTVLEDREQVTLHNSEEAIAAAVEQARVGAQLDAIRGGEA